MHKVCRKIFIGMFSAILVAVYTANYNPSSAQSIFELKFSSPQLLQKGRALLEEGDSLGAKKIYERALKTDLTGLQTARAHNGLCVAFIMEEIWQTALDHCNKAIRIYPQNWRFYNNRGNIFLETGMLKEAISEYEKGLKFSPKSDIIKNNLSLAQTRLNSHSEKSNDSKKKGTTNI